MIAVQQIVEWLMWGFFMGIGWAVGTWLVSKLLPSPGPLAGR